MNLHMLGKRLSASDRMCAFVMDLFHGKITRGGKPTRLADPPLFDALGDGPATLEVNGWMLARILKPSADLIVHASLWQRLCILPHLKWLECKIAKVIDVPYSPDDLSVARAFGSLEEIDAWWDSQDDRPELHSQVGRYGELLAPRYTDVQGVAAEGTRIQFAFEEDWFEGPLDITVSPSLVRQYPVMWHVCGTIVRDDVWSIIEPHLSGDFFWWYWLPWDG